MKILIICAMEAERDGFLNKLNVEPVIVNGIKIYKAFIDNKEIYLAKSAVGKVNAAMLTTALTLKLKPTYIINAGIAGALNPDLKPLNVVASTKIYEHDLDLTLFGLRKGELDDGSYYYKGSPKLLSLLDDDVIKGQMVSGDQFINTKKQLEEIKKHFKKALTCDMEGASIAHVATLLSRKFLVIRAISDNVFIEKQDEVYFDNKPKAIEKVVEKTINLIKKL